MSGHTASGEPATAASQPGTRVSASGRADRSRVEFFQMMAWRWDITIAKKLTEGRAPEGRIEPREWAGMLQLVSINREHAAQTDVSVPLIVATVPNGGMLIIDGWHRLYKALTTGVSELSAVVLTAEEELACRMHGGEKGQGYLR
ncbi:ParB N-terminal domain-containing protein [Nonomuraea typhae]|uniref:ParB N-terminal domain-containing protein n=1 Tax=Nonomuraea typhae TaxID=2603600 RepID=UPI0012F7B0BB|nr:ParB N-terminal domain-containing protein [Nonomuraea typhae]